MPHVIPDPELELLCRHGTGTAGFAMRTPKWNMNPVPALSKSRTTPETHPTRRSITTSHEDQQHGASERHAAMPSSSSQTARTSSCSGAAHRGKTALHIAAERGNLRIVQLLLEHEVDVDVADASGRTALHYAARGARAEIVALLLAGGADSEARDGEGRSPLHAAADAECESIIRLLAQDGADLNAAIGCVIADRDGAATSINSLFNSCSGEDGEVGDVS
jgi:hypothetical protein